MSAYVIAEVVVKYKVRYAAEFVPIVSKAPKRWEKRPVTARIPWLVG